MNKVKRRPIRWIAWGDWLKAFPNCRMRNIETEFIWGQIFCTSMIMMIMTWSVVESKYFSFQKFRLTAMFLSHKIPFQIICKNWQGAKKFVFFSALGYLVFWGCNISPDSLKVVPVTALNARELFISDVDINATCTYSLLDVVIVMLISYKILISNPPSRTSRNFWLC